MAANIEHGGVTPSERYLGRLCQSTFLSLWTYSNLFRDQGKTTARADGKEICDALIVCGNDVIVFSDKSCAFPNSGSPQTDWSRWYRRAIERSVDQLNGAERWIREHPDRLFLDRECRRALPIALPPIGKCNFHLISVALGAKNRCSEALGGSGSLVLRPDIVGQGHVGPECTPFHIGEANPGKSFVHVFDDVTLDVVLGELDTISDFIRYLRCKESFVRAGKLAVAAGEENLLAYYITRVGPSGGHEILLPPEYDQLVVQDGRWEKYLSSSDLARKRAANRTSYLWDRLIEEFCRHTLEGTAISSTTSIKEAEYGFRIMAQEPRLDRRGLSDAWIDRVRTASKAMISLRTVMSSELADTAYVFMCMPETFDAEERYRSFRRHYLEAYCFVLAWKRNLRRVVGIASEPGIGKNLRSHDFLVFEPEGWPPEEVEKARFLQEKLDILHDHKVKKRDFHDDEYPAEKQSMEPVRKRSAVVRKGNKVGRNDPCPCGSPRKFKHCCLRRAR